MKKLLVIACVATAGFAFAQEVAPADGGTEAIAQAQETKVEAPTPAKFKSAEKVLAEVAKSRGWETRWGRKKGRIIKIESAEFVTKDPSTDKKFFTLRDLAAKKAVLKAKVGIIETFGVEMSGSDMLDVPGSDVEKELSAERTAAMEAVEAQKKVMIKLLEQTDKAEAVANGTAPDVTDEIGKLMELSDSELVRQSGKVLAQGLKELKVTQKLDALMNAGIKKLDAEYNAGAQDEANKARYEDLKKKYAEAQKQFAELKAKADKMQKALKSKQTSATTKIAKLPLFGASVIMQTESWDKTTGRYQVAVLVTWSKVLEEAARAIATGHEMKTKPPANGKTVNAWLAEQDLGSMIGPRQYVDNEGNRWFLGISARRYAESMNSSARERARDLAEMSASQMAVFSIFADLESFKEAKAVVETRGDADDEAEEEDAVAESMAKKLSQTFKNKKVNGLQELASEEVENVIAGQTVYVKVYGINANDAMEAMKMEDLNIATKIESNRYQTQLKGRAAANEAAIKQSENRPEDFAAGASKQTGTLASELEKRNPKPAPIIQRGSSVKPAPGSVKSASGTFGGDANVSDDF